MHMTNSLAALALWLTAALASPLPQAGGLQTPPTSANGTDTQPPDDCPECGPDGQPPLDYCGVSTFNGQTSVASPLADDCLHIVQNIQKGAKWSVESVTGNQHQLVEWGTCAFGVQPVDHVGGYFEIGNLDIIDIFHDAVEHWSGLHGGRIGGWGYMKCGGSLGAHTHGVQWGIYHTSSGSV